jgi:uncharacterized membrane protein
VELPTPQIPTPHIRKRRRPSGVGRSVVKTITYRIVSASSTVTLAWAMFGSLEMAGAFGLVDLILNSVLYFSHERVWARIGVRFEDADGNVDLEPRG